MAICTLHGVGVSRGYAIGKAIKLQRDLPEIIEYTLPATLIEDEIQRFRRGVEIAKKQLSAIRDRIPDSAPADVNAFIDTHLLMLQDSLLAQAPIELIRQRQCNAEWALQIQRNSIVQVFEEMDDAYLRTRKDDIDHVVARIQRALMVADSGSIDLAAQRYKDHIIIADDLTPADTILLQHQGVVAFVTEYGGPLSHTAILARSLEIPAVVGVRRARRYLQDEELLVVDGRNGVVLAGLDDAILSDYRAKQTQDIAHRRALDQLRSQPAISRDGISVDLHANIELPEDTAAAERVDASGVGLYRTEFLYMNRPDLPDEEEHLAAYLQVINTLAGRPITIRTVDLGADKQVDGGRNFGPMPTNPALGLRGIRLCLQEQEQLFRPQLRAILRASALGPVRLMIPMLSNAQEMFQVLQLVADVKQELQSEGHDFDANLPIGGMIEIPAAAVCAAYFAHDLDFLSIGTNDLIQYALAIDRIDDAVNYLYDPLHPAVLNLIHMTIAAGQHANIPVSLCGEMAGDPRYTRLLLGLGLTQFSMHPANLLEVKQMVIDSEVGVLKQQLETILRTSDVRSLESLLREIVSP